VVAGQFKGSAQAAQLALLDGRPGAVWVGGGRPVVAFVFGVEDGKVVDIELVADAGRLGEMEIEVLG
jgi:RNA polymerase sigma-70 factor (ECF subfamily)